MFSYLSLLPLPSSERTRPPTHTLRWTQSLYRHYMLGLSLENLWTWLNWCFFFLGLRLETQDFLSPMCAVLICRSRGVRIHPSARHSEFHTHIQSIWSCHQLLLPSPNLSQHISPPSPHLMSSSLLHRASERSEHCPQVCGRSWVWVTYQWPDLWDKWCFSWSCHLQTGSSAGGGAHEPLLHPCSNVGQLDLAQCPCAAMS